jgi:sRNA-binding protein
MMLCAGLERLAEEGKGWKSCPREANLGDRFCAEHRDALDGAFLGLLRRGKNRHAIQILFEEAAEALRNACRQERWRRRRALAAEKRRQESAAQTAEPEKNSPAPEISAAAPEIA